MPNNLSDLVKKNIKVNNILLSRGSQKMRNQEVKEFLLKGKLKKCIIYSTILSTLAFGTYGGLFCLQKYKDYMDQQNKKIVYYQKKFGEVKNYYNNQRYIKADVLSEKLQGEMNKELFLSPTKELRNKVKEYDNKFIDPEIKRIKRERFYRSLNELPRKIFYKLENKWDDTAPWQKAVAYLGGLGLLIYIWRKF